MSKNKAKKTMATKDKNDPKTSTDAQPPAGATTQAPDLKKMAPRIFGTDGIRGTANTFPMTTDIVMKVGQAMGHLLQKNSRKPGHKHLVLIGKDTRISGYMLEQALSSGFNSMGIHVNLTGPLPTPGIGFLARNMRADAGIVISASHNAFGDNGIKIFGADGFKISTELEREIERLVFEQDMTSLLVDPPEIGRSRRIDDAAGRYIVNAKNSFPIEHNLEGLRIVVDCANGAAYNTAPAIFQELGAEIIILGEEPNGFNINDKAGALHPDKTAKAVIKYRADLGISLDGDADRVIMVDEKGKIVDGDHILALCAIHMSEQGKLPKKTVVATLMSNLGLDVCLKKHGISVVRTKVGDKNVVEEMRKNDYALGGEQSGHIIHLEHSTTGDGCVAALNVLAVMKEQNKTLSELNAIMQDIPQILINTRVSDKVPLEELRGYQELVDQIEKELGDEGRILVRYSGTEPLVRILVEGIDKKKIQYYAESIASFLQRNLS